MLLRGAGVLALSGVIIAVVSSEGLLPGADEPRLAATSLAPPQDERPAQPVAIGNPLPGPTDTAMTAVAPDDAIEAAKEAVRRAARGEAAAEPAAAAEPLLAAPRVATTPGEIARAEPTPAAIRVEAHSAPPATPATAALEAALAAKAAASAGIKRVATPPATGSVGEEEQAAAPAPAEPALTSAVTAELEAALAAKAAALKALSAEPAPASPPTPAVAVALPAAPTASVEAAAPAELPVLQNAALDLSQDPALLEDEGSTEQDLAAPLPRPRPEPPPNAIKRTASRARDWGNLGPPPNCGEKHAYWRYTDRQAGKREWYCK
jgi:hypothetical protein